LCARLAQIIFKQGDDVRQDQLVLNIIQLMDRLLKKEKLDLQLTSYKVLATAPSQGMIEFIQAEPLAKILAENNNDLQAFLRKHNRDDNADYQIAPAVMDTYVKSCGAPLPDMMRWRISCPDRCPGEGRLSMPCLQPAFASLRTCWASATVTWTTCCSQRTAS